jgi:hypothetical protein
MIAKVILGNSFRAVCFYLCQESKDAEVLASVGVRTDSAQHMAEDFTFQQQLRPTLGKAVLHIALSLRPEDAEGLSPGEVSMLLEATGRAYQRELAKEIGPLKTQWTLVQHFDKDHPHAHLVLNRVDDHGKVIPDAFIGEYSRRACQRVEQQFGLATAEEQGRKQAQREGQTNRQAAADTPREKRIAGRQRARHTVANALILLDGQANDFAELADKLKPHNIKQVVSEHQQADGTTRYGVRFELDGHRFKGGEVGKDFTAPKLMQKFAQYQAEAPTRQATASKLEAQLAQGERAAQPRAVSVVPPPQEVQGNGQLPGPVSAAVLSPAVVAAGLSVDLKEVTQPMAGHSSLTSVVPADPPAAASSVEAVAQQSRQAPDTSEGARQEELLRQAAEQVTADALAGIRQEWVNMAALVQEAAQAERVGDYGRVAELRYGAIQEVEQRIAAHEEQAKATPAGHGLLDEMHVQEQDRRRVAAQVEDAEQQRREQQRTAEDVIQKAEEARQRAEAPQIERQRRANAAIAAFQQAHQQVAEYRTQTDEAREERDYVSVGILRGIITRAERHVQHCEVELRRTLGPADSLVHIEAQKKLQQEQAQAKYEREQLAGLESFRRHWPYGGTHIRLQVPAEYVPTVTAAIGRRNHTEYEWQEHADKTISPRVIDGKVAINVHYETKENDAKLDDALREFRKNGVEVFEQPVDRTKREERAANARAFEQQYAEKMSRSNALPDKQIDSPPQIEM